MDQSPRHTTGTTCIPSLFPRGVDPNTVDFRTFFPYLPTEVTLRKRTSPTQLKVLEDIFREDTKPNAALRNKLAAELDMLPRAVRVWFQNRRAKDKALRRRVQDSIQQGSPFAHSPLKSPSSRDTFPHDASNSSTPTEKPTHPAEDDQPPSPEPRPVERLPIAESPLTKFYFSLPAPPTQAWESNPATPTKIPPHFRPLPITISMPSADANQPSAHFPDRRKSVDVSLVTLIRHSFPRVAKEKNDAIFLRPPISPAGSGQSIARPLSGLGGPSLRATSYHSSASYSPCPRPSLAHRASEPRVFTPTRSSLVPEIRPPYPFSHVPRRPSDNRSRALPSPIPGPLANPDFQFGALTSASPPHVLPDAESRGNMHAWAFACNEADQDTEDF